MDLMQSSSSSKNLVVTPASLENFLCDRGRLFPAVIATLISHGYTLESMSFSNPANVEWNALASDLLGCFPAVDFDFQQTVTVSGHLKNGALEANQNFANLETNELFFQWKLAEEAFQEYKPVGLYFPTDFD
jgi:hypothetical protein